MFTLDEFLARAKPGDIFLTANPAGLGSLINFGQGLEDGNGGMKSQYGHVAIVAAIEDEGVKLKHWHVDGHVYESVMVISHNHIRKYYGKECCVIRHREMTIHAYFKGLVEVKDNIGQLYPVHRIVFHGFDMINSWVKRVIFRRSAPLRFRYMKFMPLDWPVCSELGAQFIHAAGLEGGWEDRKKGWRGVNPDDFYDCAVTRADLWTLVLEGTLVAGTVAK